MEHIREISCLVIKMNGQIKLSMSDLLLMPSRTTTSAATWTARPSTAVTASTSCPTPATAAPKGMSARLVNT